MIVLIIFVLGFITAISVREINKINLHDKPVHILYQANIPSLGFYCKVIKPVFEVALFIFIVIVSSSSIYGESLFLLMLITLGNFWNNTTLTPDTRVKYQIKEKEEN